MTNIVDFAARRAQQHQQMVDCPELPSPKAGVPEEATTESVRNSRERAARREVWRVGEYRLHYWRARIDLDSATGTLVRWLPNSPEAKWLPNKDRFYYDYRRMDCLEKWRRLVVKQLLTPAPDVRAVMWKKAHLKEAAHVSATSEAECRRAIEDDERWLAEHPTRRSRNRPTASET